jgi:galactokinase
MIDSVLKKWHAQFGSTRPEVIVRSPGRVNIIGEHTDYNEGWVMPGAMSRSLYILASRAKGKQGTWIATDLQDETKVEAFPDADTLPMWAKYFHGSLHVFGESIGPLNLLVGGDLPIGAGISSSSSLVCGLLVALQEMTGVSREKRELAHLARRVERDIIGLQGGIMDQFAIMLSEPEKVMLLDCRFETYEYIDAALPDAAWVLLNTRVKHQLIDSDYNQRSQECRQAVEYLQTIFPEIKSLRDVTPDMLHAGNLPQPLHDRARFVIEENHRVHKMQNALEQHDANEAGRLLMASHVGLRDLYKVSCEELDQLASMAHNTPGVYGGRMMGGGFGGCVICLVQMEAMDSFLSRASDSYRNQFGMKPEVIHFSLDQGAHLISA